ncbi:alpha/beta hydrolase [Streptomyces sp. G-G2]|uniref:alpha/beta hydrolase n=1 Tax=Streptomyces sp. G-G2 TaxID=3046201 RepID=UPI0024B9CF26|nr:alpha/beta hydrolase [Streptomyces sp. G-G2]MDJ0382076.1 alpha/beta hydrolase [Streptomyces sp. G-G2]
MAARVTGRVSAPAVLVGHSWGGFVITAAGTDDRVGALVYIAALAPDAGESTEALIGKFDPPPLFSHLDSEDGRLWIARAGISHFCGDLPEEERQLVWATQGAPRAELLGTRTDEVAWRSKPSQYIVAKQDHAINPELERFMAERIATTVEADTSHVPMLSRPELVLDSIRAAARQI